MAFPEIRQKVSEWFKHRDDGKMLSLDLKQGLTFDTVSVQDVNWYLRNGYPQIAAILAGGLPSYSGETVNLSTALSHSVVWACNNVVSTGVAFLPSVLMQQTKSGKKEAADHPMFGAMKWSPNAEITSQAFRELLTSHALLGGNGYAKILRRSGTGVAMEFETLLPEQVTPDREKTGQKRLVYVIDKDLGSASKTYTVDRTKPQELFHLRGIGYDGIRGYSVIQMGRQSIGSALAAEKYIGAFWRNGGRLPYVLQKGKFKSDKDFEDFRKQWQATYADPANVPITEGDLEYKPVGSSMADAQATESRTFTVAEICRWFNVPLHLVQELERATFNNIEELQLTFLKQTLLPWLTRWEQDFHRCVLTPEEQSQGYYLKHNLNAFLRGDFQKRLQGFAQGLQNGIYDIDEVRDLEDLDPLPDGQGKHHHIQLNMQTLDGSLPSDTVWSGSGSRGPSQQQPQQGKGKWWLHRMGD